MILYGLSFALALLLSLYLTPLMRSAALHFQMVDRPDGRLKNHREPIPYLGGLAVYLAVLVTLCVTFPFDRQLLGLLLGSTLVLLLGLIDDFGFLSPRVKLAGETLAAFVLVKSGVHMELEFVPNWLNFSLSMVWIVVLTNAFNLIDIMDGLATGVGALCALVLFYVAWVNDRPAIAIMAASTAGALAGFLRYNFEPAKIYLGDAGSLFLGCVLGSLAMIGSYTQSNRLGVLAPLVILGVPIFDTLFVSYVRWRRGMSILKGSPDHFALRLRKWRLSTRQTVLVSYGFTMLLGIASIGMISTTDFGAAAILLGILALGCGLGILLKKIDMTM